MEAVSFEVLKSYGEPPVYFSKVNNSCLISIPSWNWSFLMDHDIDFRILRPMLMETLEKHVSEQHLENVVDVFFDYVFSEF